MCVPSSCTWEAWVMQTARPTRMPATAAWPAGGGVGTSGMNGGGGVGVGFGGGGGIGVGGGSGVGSGIGGCGGTSGQLSVVMSESSSLTAVSPLPPVTVTVFLTVETAQLAPGACVLLEQA